MPLIFVEGFETYDQTQSQARFGGVVNVVQGFGGAGTRGVQVPQNGSGYGITTGVIPATSPNLAGAVANYTYFLGCALKFTAAPFRPFVLQLQDQVYANPTAFPVGYFIVAANGSLQVYRNGYGGTALLAASNTGFLRPNRWYFLEMRYTADGTSGMVEARIDGLSVLSVSSLNTLDATPPPGTVGAPFANPPNLISLLGGSLGSVSYDDLYVISSTVTPPGNAQNTYYGPAAVEGLFPSNVGDHTQFQPIGNSPNFNCVNTPPPMPLVSDPDYVQTAASAMAPAATDTYQMTDLSRVTVSPLKAVRMVTVAYGVDNLLFGEVACRGGAMWTGSHQMTAFPTPQSYTAPPVYEQILENDPLTSAAWTGTNLNSTQMGVYVSPPA